MSLNYLENQSAYNNIGIDEVGRGPLAGPVVAASVFLPSNLHIPESIPFIRDSKKLSHNNRMKIINWVHLTSDIKYSIGIASVSEIDKLNILQASLLAMERSFTDLLQKICEYDYVFIDGNKCPNICADKNVITVIGGDDKLKAVSLASILAKEFRDNIMVELDKEYPEYKFAKNAGYGTREHIEALKLFGFTKHHRKSFSPIRSMTSKFA